VVQLSKAFEFLEGLESDFLHNVVHWLRHMQDPTDVLLDLSHDLGQNLGPWETFRFCSLLKLTPAQPVRGLGEEVLAEPYEPEEGIPPVAQAFALAHAHFHWPEIAAPAAPQILAALQAFSGGVLPASVLDAAQMALCGPGGACPDEILFGQLTGNRTDDLDAGTEAAGISAVFEACLVTQLGAQHPLHRRFRDSLAQSQLPDGSFPAFATQRMVRGLVTVKALALLRF